jgi:hypothetical protein
MRVIPQQNTNCHAAFSACNGLYVEVVGVVQVILYALLVVGDRQQTGVFQSAKIMVINNYTFISDCPSSLLASLSTYQSFKQDALGIEIEYLGFLLLFVTVRLVVCWIFRIFIQESY